MIWICLKQVKYLEVLQIQQYRNRRNKIMCSGLIIFTIIFEIQANYILNGDFSDPPLSVGGYGDYTSILGWTGSMDLRNPTPGAFREHTSQYVDLQLNSGNGYIQQTVTLPTTTTYIIAFSSIAYTSSHNSYTIQIWWDNNLETTFQPNTTGDITREYIQIITTAGSHLLRLTEIGINDGIGILLDDVCMEQLQQISCGLTFNVTVNNTTDNNTQIVDPEKSEQKHFQTIIKYISSLPFNQLIGFKYISIFVDDLAIYFYDDRYYNRTMQDLLFTINLIEQFKWSLFNSASKMPINSSIVPNTDMAPFSNKKHMEVDEVDDSFARSSFPFFLFFLPQMILIVFVFRNVFKCLYQYKLSVYFRRYSFAIVCITQILVEDNISFLTYLFFRQAFILFSLKFTDKIFLVVSLVLFGLGLVFACCFYFLANEIYQKRCGYFLYCFYRCFPAFVFLTCRHFLRGFLRGAIHSCLHTDYRTAIILLSIMQSLIIVMAIWVQKKHKIFLSQVMFHLTLIYHFLFILINLVLYEQQILKKSIGTQKMIDLFLFFQQAIIYALITTVLIEFIADFMPTNESKEEEEKDDTKKQKQQLQDDESIIRNNIKENGELNQCQNTNKKGLNRQQKRIKVQQLKIDGQQQYEGKENEALNKDSIMERQKIKNDKKTKNDDKIKQQKEKICRKICAQKQQISRNIQKENWKYSKKSQRQKEKNQIQQQIAKMKIQKSQLYKQMMRMYERAKEHLLRQEQNQRR